MLRAGLVALFLAVVAVGEVLLLRDLEPRPRLFFLPEEHTTFVEARFESSSLAAPAGLVLVLVLALVFWRNRARRRTARRLDR